MATTSQRGTTGKSSKTMELWHSSCIDAESITVEDREDNGYYLFSGLFCLNMEDAGRGDYLYKIEIPENEILDSFLNIDDELVINAVEHVSGINRDDDEFDTMYNALVFEDYDLDIAVKLTEIDDPSYAGWEMQNMRGRLAQSLGYRAVSMKDEYGTSYLVLPGNTLTRI